MVVFLVNLSLFAIQYFLNDFNIACELGALPFAEPWAVY